MSVTTDCLANIIGLSRNTCECFDVPVNTSDSGIYLDEVEGLNLLQVNAGADCGNGSLWDLMLKARTDAIGQYKADLSARLIQAYKPSRNAFKGQIGRSDSKDSVTPDSIAGLQILCSPVKNGAIIINRIGLMFASTGTITVSIYNNISDEPVVEFENLSTVAGKLTWANIDKTTLPMHTTEADYLTYYMVYTYTGNKPKDNKLQCVTCSGKQVVGYSCNNPSFDYKHTDARYEWYRWLNITGVTGADIDTLKAATPGFKNLTYGLVLDAEVKCNMPDIACNDTDYTNSGVALAMAYTVRFRAAEFLCNAILSSGQLNRYTMLEREALYGKRNQYRKEYSDRLDWIVENMNITETGCLQCNPKVTKGSLLNR